MANVLWMHGGACNGNTQSFLNAEEPTVIDLVTDFGINILYHHSLSMEFGEQVRHVFERILDGEVPLDIFVVEGTVIQGPNGTGRYDMLLDRPKKDWIWEFAHKAQYVVAVGDCACWGGVPATSPNPSESIGLQYQKGSHGGFLGADFRSKAGLPVINIPGCPSHPDWVTQILVAIATGRAEDVLLDELQRPQTFFKTFTQTGCTRVQYFEWKEPVEEFGQGTRKGCLFYEQGCRGPMTHSPCNRILWNRQSSKTRAGMPCIGCTEPQFPFFDLAPGTVFKTQKIFGSIPKEVPKDSDPLSYSVTAALARAAAPKWAREDMFVP
ncbi:hydrogenase [Alicyclobacillus macrosporangiidus]|uniref:NADH-quinone oxidoreductase subunit B family protein n=1 Tax=Alicyclobacillus macrosporangiidus TaxID=392015 RepID=UPI000495C0F1|nr:hydrogenase [Alicyclobacillus macrosporangiidus]MCL6599580.1 hydrogenase [Alicyclobacillus macrosporangiidus]